MSKLSFELLRKHWIWPLLVTGLTLLLTIYSAYLQHRSAQHEMGGSLMATFYNHSLNNREARTIVVCMEDADVNLRGLYVTPTFDNPSEFSIKDFSLSFNVQCSNVTLVPSSFVETHPYGGDEWLYKYKENLLAAHDDTKRIFTDYKVAGNTGHCFIETKASYDGAAAAFEYNTDVWFLIVPKKRAQSYDDWKINCKKRIFDVISDKYYDVYYYSQGNGVEYQFDVALGNDDNAVAPNPSPQMASSNPAPQPAPQPTPKEETKPQPAPQPSKPAVAKETPATNGRGKTETKPVEVTPAIKSQDVNIVKYSTSKEGKRFTIRYELDKAPATSGEYLLYGHYTVPGNDALYWFAHPTDLSTVSKSYTYSITVVDSLPRTVHELRLISQANPDDLVEIGQDAGRRTFKNVSNNKIVLVAYTSATRCRIDILEKSEFFYDDKGNDNRFYVYDTGEASTKGGISDMPWGMRMVIWIVLIFGTMGFFVIGTVIGDAVDHRTNIFTEFYETIRENLSDDSIFLKIMGVIFMVSPICTVFFIILMFFL